MPEIVIPTDGAELEEMLNDSAKLQALAGQPERFGEFVRNYVQCFVAKNKDVGVQIREQTQQVLGSMLRDAGGDLDRINLGATNQAARKLAMNTSLNTIYNAAAPGAQLNQTFENSAEYFQAVWHRRDTLPNSEELNAKLDKVRKVQNSYGSTVPSDGGFLIPEVMRAEILSLALQSSIVRPRATVLPMSSLTLPVPKVDETSHASSVYGGIICYWTSEAAALTDSSAKFGRTVLEAKKLTAYTQVPNELMADAPAFNAFLGQKMPQAMAWFEDAAFTNGSGVGEPLGFVNGSATISVTRNTAVTGQPVDFGDIASMYARMLPSSLGSAVWIISNEVLPSLLQMALATGNATTPFVAPPLLLEGQQAIGAFPFSILGRPVLVSEHMAQSTVANDIMFVDLSYYLVGDRQAMTSAASSDFRFQNDETAFRVIERVDGRPWIDSAITPANGGDTLSPFVGLAA